MKYFVLLVAMIGFFVMPGCAHKKFSLEDDYWLMGSPSPKKIAARKFPIYDNTEFLFKANVLAAGSGVPVPYAEVYFIDTALDRERAAQTWTARLGTADRFGVVDQIYWYFWSADISFQELGVSPPIIKGLETLEAHHVLTAAFYQALAAANPPRTFSIEIRKAGYATYRKDIDFSALKFEFEERHPDKAFYDLNMERSSYKGHAEWLEKFSPSAIDLGTISLAREATP